MQWLAEICVKRPVFATMLIFSLVVVGAFSFFSLGVDLFPKIDFPTVTITTINRGSSPQEIETEISKRIEETINTISGIDELRSTSVEGVSQVFVQFLLDKDADIAAQEVRDKVNLILSDLPETAEQPTIQKLDTDAAPILRIAVSAPIAIRDITTIADNQIKQRIESINGVGQVTIVGGRKREIHVWLDPDKMRSYSITATDVSNAVKVQNQEFPSGRIDEGKNELTIRALGKITKPEQFNDIVVATRGNYQVRVKDLGYVEDGAEEQRTEARLNGNPAVTLIVAKQSGSNSVAVADAIKERLKEIQPSLPPNFQTRIIGDQSVFIKASLNSIEEHLVVGGFLAAVIVFLFLWNIRTTFIAALAIPTSIISTFGAMYIMNFTLNQITMLSLTLMVGIVIDDAIVVLENIFRYVEEKGMSPFQAAVEGTREIGLAVLATTLSLVAVFLPIGFMGGIVGRFMSSFGITATFAILVSLLVSFSLTPMLAARLIKAEPGNGEKDPDGKNIEGVHGDGMIENKPVEHKPKDTKDSRFYRPIDRTYTALLKFSMAHRWIIIVLCLLVVISIVPLFMFVGKNFLPVDDQSQFEMSIRAPEGTTLAATSGLLERVASEVRQMPGVSDTLVTIGGDQQQLVNNASIYVKMSDLDQRTVSQETSMVNARALLQRFVDKNPTLRTSVQPVAAISGGGVRNADVQYIVAGPDLQKLEEISAKIVEKFKSIPDAVDVDSSLISGKPEVQLKIDRVRAGDLGVRVGDISQALNTLVAGQEATTYNEGNDQYEVHVRAINNFRTSIEGLKRMIVPSAKLGFVSLDSVVTPVEGTGPSSIERTNRQRQVTISGNVRPGGSQAAVLSEIDAFAKSMKIDPGYTTGVAGRSKELARTGTYFLIAISLSFIFMYIVLAAQFESFIHPITILLTLPLSIPFGIISLLAFGQTVNIFSGLGLLLLFGVVKKNAILQIDHTNHLRSTGMSRYDAIIQANRDRLRPILMTTIALVAGMMPLVVSTGPGAGTNRSVGVLVVGGQSLCLLLTLLAVPVFYSLFDDLGEFGFFRRASNISTKVFGGLKRKTSAAVSSSFNTISKN